MIELPQVTLIALGSKQYFDNHQKALNESCKGIKFGAVKNITQDCNGIDEWNKAIIYDLGQYIDTEFAILIHADGYIVNPESWNDDWLNYDYIGAPWPQPQDNYSYRDIYGKLQRVGNSVSLRSRRLIDYAKKQKLEWKSFNNFSNEDGFICVNYRHEYEKAGFIFAPLEVAKYFSRELDIPENEDVESPFAFHAASDISKIGRNIKYPVFEI